MSDKPPRAHVLQLNIQGDTWENIIAEVRSILYSLQSDGPTPVRLCAGGGGSWIMEYAHHPEVTPESYTKDVSAWLEQQRTNDE